MKLLREAVVDSGYSEKALGGEHQFQHVRLVCDGRFKGGDIEYSAAAHDKSLLRIARTVQCAANDLALFENMNIGRRHAHVLDQVNRNANDAMPLPTRQTFESAGLLFLTRCIAVSNHKAVTSCSSLPDRSMWQSCRSARLSGWLRALWRVHFHAEAACESKGLSYAQP